MLFFDKPDLFGKDLHLLFVFYQLLYLYIYFYYNALKMLVLNMYICLIILKMLNHTYTQKPYYYTILKCSDYIYNFQKSHTRTIYIYIYNLDPKKEKKNKTVR